MGLEIGIAEDTVSLNPSRNAPIVTLENDGYYWYLHPLFEELREQTAQYIDLYGDAVFSEGTLDAMGKMLSKARELVEGQPKRWEVHIGTQTGPDQTKELDSTVEKTEMLKMIRQLDEIVAMAGRMGLRVVCFGD